MNFANQLLSRSFNWLILTPRLARRLIALVTDAALCAVSVYIAYGIRVGAWMLGVDLWFSLTWMCLVYWFPIAYVLGVYRSMIRFSGLRTIADLMVAVACATVPTLLVFSYYTIEGVPRTFGILQPIVFGGLVIGTRILFQFALIELIERPKEEAKTTRIAIYGSGRLGQQLALSLRHERTMHVVGFIDDNPQHRGQTIDGQPVFPAGDLPRTIADYRIDEILLAMPNVTRKRRREIIETLKDLAVHVRSLPSYGDIIEGQVTVSDLREIQIDDLLGRTPVIPHPELLTRTIGDKVVMVTGAGGSIGSELCRQALASRPARLVLVDNSEYNLYRIEHELEELNQTLGCHTEIIAELCSVTNAARIERTMHRFKPFTVLHAAAYKHVPLVEKNPMAGLENNVLGTLHTALAAESSGVRNFILISTDKAVRPTSIMGATKRICELVLQALDKRSGESTTFSMVRFGNVLGSSGSVVPQFRAQILAGGPVTLTHRDITRYFMTIPEAASLVIQASALARGGDVFLLDMGESIRIIDLARTMIQLSGLTVRDQNNPEGDIAIEEVGLRPGEKLFEELLIDKNSRPSEHPRIMTADEPYVPWEELSHVLEQMAEAVTAGDSQTAVQLIRSLVPQFTDQETQATLGGNEFCTVDEAVSR